MATIEQGTSGADSAAASGLGPGSKAAWEDRELHLPGRGDLSIRHARGPSGAPSLVLLHGLAATGRLNWSTSLRALAEHFNVVVVDHRGHGRGVRTKNFRLKDCADDIAAVADELAIPRFIAVGYSMGGPIAKLCWSRHPDRVSGLVLCATARHFARRQIRVLAGGVLPGAILAAKLMPGVFRGRMISGMLRGARESEALEYARRELAASDPASILQATRALARFSSHDWVSDIDVPTAVLVMTRDKLVPTSHQYKLAAAIPGAKVFEVDGDHLACVTARDRFVPALSQACRYVAEHAELQFGSTSTAAN